MPSGRSPPPGFGIITRRTGSGRYVFETSSSRRPASHCLQARRLDLREGHPVHARRTRIGAGQRIGVTQNVFAINLVVEHVEAEGRLRLRLAIELSLKAPDLLGVARLIANHLHLTIFESTPEVRVLCSAGITRPQRSYDPVRLPPWPPPVATLRPLPSPTTGLPRLPEPPFRRAVPTTPADRAGARVDCFPAHAAFPKWQEGRHPHCHFRGLLRLHSRYGPPDRSAAQGDLCHEAPAQPVTRPSRSSASGSIDNSPGGIFLH